MEIGSGIAAAGTAFAIAAIVMKWIGRATTQQCNMHAALAQQISGIEAWLDKVEKKLDRVIERI